VAVAYNAPRGKIIDGGQHELAEVISNLQSCLEASERLELTLLGAMIEQALCEARKYLAT
jgi:hypothetical protein